jgi:hypothetical protein
MIKGNTFVWNDIKKHAFSALKEAMCTTLVLVVLDFNKNFFMECDTLGRGLGIVLMQAQCPLEFNSKKLCDNDLGKLTYEKKMMAILHAVNTWHLYLIGWNFHIKMYHHNMKYFLE